MFRGKCDFGNAIIRLVEGSVFSPTVGVLTAAIDGSGTLRPKDRCISFVATYANEEAWRPFCEEWWGVIHAHNLQYFRATEAMNLSGHFREAWGDGDHEKRREDLLLTLIGLQKKYHIKGIGRVSDARFLTERSIAKRKMLVFRELVEALLNDVSRDFSFHLMSDDEQDLVPEIYGLYKKIKVQNPEARNRLVGVSFMDDRFLPQVQLADLCAYFGRKETMRHYSRPSEVPDHIYSKLMDPLIVPSNDIREVHDTDASDETDETDD